MMCKDCKLKKCVHSFNASNVDNCNRMNELRRNIWWIKKNTWQKPIYKFIETMEKDYNRCVEANFDYRGHMGFPYLNGVTIKIW